MSSKQSKGTSIDKSKGLFVPSSASAQHAAVTIPNQKDTELVMTYFTRAADAIQAKVAKRTLKKILRFMTDTDTAGLFASILDGRVWTSDNGRVTVSGLFDLTKEQLTSAGFQEINMGQIRNLDDAPLESASNTIPVIPYDEWENQKIVLKLAGELTTNTPEEMPSATLDKTHSPTPEDSKTKEETPPPAIALNAEEPPSPIKKEEEITENTFEFIDDESSDIESIITTQNEPDVIRIKMEDPVCEDEPPVKLNLASQTALETEEIKSLIGISRSELEMFKDMAMKILGAIT